MFFLLATVLGKTWCVQILNPTLFLYMNRTQSSWNPFKDHGLIMLQACAFSTLLKGMTRMRSVSFSRCSINVEETLPVIFAFSNNLRLITEVKKSPEWLASLHLLHLLAYSEFPLWGFMEVYPSMVMQSHFLVISDALNAPCFSTNSQKLQAKSRQ